MFKAALNIFILPMAQMTMFHVDDVAHNDKSTRNYSDSAVPLSFTAFFSQLFWLYGNFTVLDYSQLSSASFSGTAGAGFSKKKL